LGSTALATGRVERRLAAILGADVAGYSRLIRKVYNVGLGVSIQHYPMVQRNLIYTAVTREKRLVVLVGHWKALAIAVKGARKRRRWSKLREWLTSGGIETIS
jgi:hypothetical protein